MVTPTTKEQIKSEFLKTLEPIADSFANKFIDDLQVYEQQMQQETKLKLPSNKVILSADVFSELVNMASYVGNIDDQYAGLYDRMLQDVKDNRELVEHTAPKKEAPKKEAEQLISDWLNSDSKSPETPFSVLDDLFKAFIEAGNRHEKDKGN